MAPAAGLTRRSIAGRRRPSGASGTHGKHLKNLYVYFWRWATLKVFGSGRFATTGLPDTDEESIVYFITVAGFLNGPGFKKMRDDLRRTCSDIWVIDCCPKATNRMCRPASFRAFSSQSASCWRRESSEKARGRRRMCVASRAAEGQAGRQVRRARDSFAGLARLDRLSCGLACAISGGAWREMGGFRAAARPVHLQRFGYHARPNVDHRGWRGDIEKALGAARQRERREKEGTAFSPTCKR